MDAHHDNPPSPDLPRAVEEKLTSFNPRTLDSTRWELARPRLLELTRATAPKTPMRAATVLSSACRFLSDVAPTGSCDVDELLTEAKVAGWSHRMRADGMDDGTLANHLGRMNGLLRAKAGHGPVESDPSQRRNRRPPYDPEELLALAEKLAPADPPAAAAIVAGAGAALLVPDVDGAAVAADATGVAIVTAAGERKSLTPRWSELASRLSDVTIDRSAWNRARAAADAEPLNHQRVHLTWAVDALGTDRSLRELVDDTGLGRLTLDSAVRHLPPVDTATRNQLLRG